MTAKYQNVAQGYGPPPPSQYGPPPPQQQYSGYPPPAVSPRPGGYGPPPPGPPPPTAGYGYGPPPPGGPMYNGRPGLPSVQNNSYMQGNLSAPPPPPQETQGFGAGAPQGYGFKYSNCTGRRKALLIGINYFGSKSQLRGCINDVKNMSAYLNGNFGYAREDMVILTDDQQNPMSQPTKANMLRAMHWLVKDAQPNDSLFFHYSGTLTRPTRVP